MLTGSSEPPQPGKIPLPTETGKVPYRITIQLERNCGTAIQRNLVALTVRDELQINVTSHLRRNRRRRRPHTPQFRSSVTDQVKTTRTCDGSNENTPGQMKTDNSAQVEDHPEHGPGGFGIRSAAASGAGHPRNVTPRPPGWSTADRPTIDRRDPSTDGAPPPPSGDDANTPHHRPRPTPEDGASRTDLRRLVRSTCHFTQFPPCAGTRPTPTRLVTS